MTMGSPIGYLMAHVIINYATDKALEINPLNRGRQLMTRQQILSGPRSLPAQKYKYLQILRHRGAGCGPNSF